MSKHSIQNDPEITRLIEESNIAYMIGKKIHHIQLQQELITLYESQIMDLTIMSKIELGDDVIAEIRRIKEELKKMQ
jgi:predicted transcriptional regulator